MEAPLGSEVEAMVRTTTLVPGGRAGLAYPGVAEEEGFQRAGLPVRAQAEQPGPAPTWPSRTWEIRERGR